MIDQFARGFGTEDRESRILGNYCFFLEEYGVLPWEFDQLDTVFIQALQVYHNTRIREKKEEERRIARR